MIGSIQHINGMQVIISEYVDEYESIPAKRHRRKRIQKKWAKRWGWKKIMIKASILRMGDSLIMSSKSYEKLVREIRDKDKNQSRKGMGQSLYNTMAFS